MPGLLIGIILGDCLHLYLDIKNYYIPITFSGNVPRCVVLGILTREQGPLARPL